MPLKTNICAYDDGLGLGIITFHPNTDLPHIDEYKTNELSGIYNAVVESMYRAQFFGCGHVTIENGDHAGKQFTITITDPQITK